VSLLSLAAAQSFGGAVMEVIAHQVSRDTTQRFLHAGYLHDDVGAVAVVFHHFLQSADLPLDAAKAMPIDCFDFRIDSGSFAPNMYVTSAVRA
jgi:hypothetical protein